MRTHIRYELFTLLLALLVVPGTLRADEEPRQILNLKVGGAQIVASPDAVKRASVINPDIADIVIISPKELYAYGKQPGATTVILWGNDSSRKLIDLVVALDLTALKEKLHQLFPAERIEVHASETGVVLSGTVTGPDIVEQVLRLTRTFLPKQAGTEGGGAGSGTSGSGITNLLRVGGMQQVLLEVKFAEVTRNSNKDWQAAFGLEGLNSDFVGAAGVSNVLTPLEGPAINMTFPQAPSQSGILQNGSINGLIQNPGSLLVNFADNAANVFVQLDKFKMALHLLETEGLARTLAEPRLVTQSGKEASFLAGGEFPVPVADNDGIKIEYKKFGVSLRFTPVILSDGKISLRVTPSVSQLTSAGAVPAGIVGANFIVPSLATRQLDTTVELYDGQTLALAGLLQNNLREQVDKIPGLGDIPILGQLFRSTSYRQEKTDLLIAVTPHLVKPVKEGELHFPGERMQQPNGYEFYLEGRLEGRRNPDETSELSRHDFLKRSAASHSGGLEGTFGHLPLEAPPLEVVAEKRDQEPARKEVSP